MGRIRKISEKEHHYFLIDSCFLADKYLSLGKIEDKQKKQLVRTAHAWWKHIDTMVKKNKAKLYIPDICIAETFSVLAKERYNKNQFNNIEYQAARKKLINFVRTSPKELAKQDRVLKIHDLATTRDIIISIDRFLQVFFKNHCKTISIPDLIILGHAKSLIDFYDFPKNKLHILSSDEDLIRGCNMISDLPYCYDTRKKDPKSVFC